MERQILVPLDGSLLAEQVLPHAIQLAQASTSNLHLVQVITPPMIFPTLAMPAPTPVNIQHWTTTARLEAEHYLDCMVLQLRTLGVSAHTSVVVGEPAAEILRLASEVPGIRTITMAAHGRSGLSRMLLGSVTEQVLAATPVPLLIVRGGAQQTAGAPPLNAQSAVQRSSYQTVLVPLDGSPFADEALAYAQQLARHTHATMVLVAVVEPAPDPHLAMGGILPHWMLAKMHTEREAVVQHLETLAASLRSVGITVRLRISAGDPVSIICAAAAEEQADLVVIATHGHTGLQRFWYGSVALEVSKATPLPLLLVRAPHSREHGR